MKPKLQNESGDCDLYHPWMKKEFVVDFVTPFFDES